MLFCYIFTLFILYPFLDCVDLYDILVLCMTDSCMNTALLLDCMLRVYVGHTCIHFTSKSLVQLTLFLLIVCLVGDLLLLVCSSIELVTRSKV